MAPNPRVAKAFRAMRNLGISEEKVKPVLKKLLKLYDKNWELIEEENYRVLADTIFDTEETEAAECKKKSESTGQGQDFEEEAQVSDEPERPLKRLRLRGQDFQASPSFSNKDATLNEPLLKTPKVEDAELPETCPLNQSGSMTVSPQPNIENGRVDSMPTSPQPPNRSRGKQPVPSNSLQVQERSDPSQMGPTTRSRSNLVSSSMHLKDRGKQPVSPQIATYEKRSISRRSSSAACSKETNVDSGILHLPQKEPETLALIKPKDEPFTDADVPQDLPITKIHSDSLLIQDSSTGNGLLREPDGSEPVACKSVSAEDKNDRVSASSSENRTNFELANILNQTTGNIEIASSPFGEVKIFLNCSFALGKPDFQMPSLDSVLKLMEDKCLRSYKVLDPNFSVVKLMKDMCECFLELGTDSNDSQDTINVTPAIDLLKKTYAADVIGAGMPYIPSNGSMNNQGEVEDAATQIPKLLPPSNGMDDHTRSDKNFSGSNCQTNRENDLNGLEHENLQSLVVVQRRQLTPDDIRSLHNINDIAKGQERVVIPLVNEVNNECPPSFHYIPHNAVFQNAYVNYSLARIGDDNCCSTCFGDCLMSSTPCACSHESGGEFVYTLEGLVKDDFLEECISMNRDPHKHCLVYCKDCPLERTKNGEISDPCKGHLVRRFIKECWLKCGCSKECGNRVVQRGINHKLQVFMTPAGKGWGLRTLEALPKGAFVCEYVGEVLTNDELYERVSRSPSDEAHSYPVLLDADWGSEVGLKDEEALCLDATYYGNVARFINHRCFDSTLVEIPVEVETPDHHYYRLAFFTTRKVEALEELTWDYGIDFDDEDHPVKAFRCRCGSKFCRNIKRSNRSRSAATRR